MIKADSNTLDNELKRLHELLLLFLECDNQEMSNKVLSMIETLHQANFIPYYIVEKIND